jgi:hypothetical protein
MVLYVSFYHVPSATAYPPQFVPRQRLGTRYSTTSEAEPNKKGRINNPPDKSKTLLSIRIIKKLVLCPHSSCPDRDWAQDIITALSETAAGIHNEGFWRVEIGKYTDYRKIIS